MTQPTTERDRTKERVAKLLNLTLDKGASENEAIMAAEKAAELMAFYDIEASELSVRSARAIKQTVSARKYGKTIIAAPVAHHVAQLCDCMYWGSTEETGKHYTFLGLPADAEIAAYLRGLGLLGKRRIVLDLGCGIGRLELALAGELRRVIGIDVSSVMVAAARRRCAHLPNVEIRHCAGTDLPELARGSIDCVTAVDSFPYLVQAHPSLPERIARQAHRLLGPARDLLILNYSYRRGETRDLADVLRLADAIGYAVLRTGERPLRLWDGRVFHLRKHG